MKNLENYALQWQDDDRPTLGEGLSRTNDPSAVLWSVDVGYANGPGMRTTVRARNKSEARKFTQNRYPTATTITIHGKAR